MMSGQEMFAAASASAIAAGLASESTVVRTKAESCARVVDMINDGTLVASDRDLADAVQRMYRASGTADRSVIQAELESLQGLAFRLPRG